MATLIQDIRYALRSLRSQRAIATIAALCLALGIGANTAIFSVVRAVLLQSLPFREPERLVRLFETANFGGTRGAGSVSIPNFIDWRSQNDAFEAMAAYAGNSLDLIGNGEPERVRATRASANLFALLGARPALGRTFSLDDDQPGKAPVVVLGNGLWRRRFGADPAIVGKTISLDNTIRTVIGVMPSTFDFPISSLRTDVWVPLVFQPPQSRQRGNHHLSVVARLKPGLDSAAATARMASIAQRLAHDYPDEMKDRGIQVNSLNGVIVGQVRKPLLMLLGAVGLVLLIACANVANLLLARASGRRREVAIRIALGAERSRLIRQLLTESVLLAIAGGALGLAVAHWGLAGILAFASTALPRIDAVGLSPTVLAFSLGVSVLTGFAFGLVPALRASQTDLREDLTETAGRAGTGRAQHRTLDTLIVAEIALSLVLLTGAGLLVRGFLAVIGTDSGLRPQGVITFHLSAPGGPMSDSVRYVQFYGPVLERLRMLPGVRSASMTTLLPIQGSGWNGNFTIVGRPKETDPGKEPFAEYRVVSSSYFASLGIPMMQGREFTNRDALDAPSVVIINDEFVRRYFPNENPIGKQIFAWTSKPSTVIGVARSVHQVSLDSPPRTELYVAAAQTPWQLYGMTYVLSTRGAPEAIMPSVRAAIRDVAPLQPIFQVRTMEGVISDSLRSRKLTLSLLAIFAAVALVLSAAGVFGVMSYGVSQREREIGIRMALGARGSEVTTMVLRDAGKLVVAGIVIGLAAAAGLTRVLSGMVYGVSVRDPATFGLVAATIAVVAMVASLLPALRAARVDPIAAMRN
jgi:putative ABC transport system permease protein